MYIYVLTYMYIYLYKQCIYKQYMYDIYFDSGFSIPYRKLALYI